MNVEFGKEKIIFEGIEILYSGLQDNIKGNELFYKLLEFCVKNEETITFSETTDCTAFGKKLKQIVENEFKPSTI